MPPLKKRSILAAAILAAAVVFAAISLPRLWSRPGAPDLAMYDYRDTRRLVSQTSRAADLVRQKGPAAFEEFRRDPGRWSLGGGSYIYVYDLNGVNLYHGGYPEFVGKNLIDYTDLLGKKAGRLIIDQLEHHPAVNPHGWSHYLWVPPGALDGVWKSSCNFLVTMPDGRRVWVGSGIDNPHEEREFYRIIVDEAAVLLEREGRSALDSIRAPEGPFTIHDRGIFVVDEKGNALIDPGFNLDTPRNLFDYRDMAARRPLAELYGKLQTDESAWVIMLNQERAGSKPAKKGIYGRRATMDGKGVIVGAICPLPRPAWMN